MQVHRHCWHEAVEDFKLTVFSKIHHDCGNDYLKQGKSTRHEVLVCCLCGRQKRKNKL